MSDDIDVRSVAYLRDLADLYDNAAEDPACICAGWAAGEIERLTAEVSRLTKLLATWTRGDVVAEVERLQACNDNDLRIALHERLKESAAKTGKELAGCLSKLGGLEKEVERLQRDYAEFEELSPPDVPRKEFVAWCFRAWEEKCEREQREAAEAAGGD